MVVWVRRDTSSSRRQGLGTGSADLVAVRCQIAPCVVGEGCSGIQANAALCGLAWPNGERRRPSGEPLNPRSFSDRLVFLKLSPPCYVLLDVTVSSRGFLGESSKPRLQISSLFFRSHPLVWRQGTQALQRMVGILCSGNSTLRPEQGVIWFDRVNGDAALPEGQGPSPISGAIALLPASDIEPDAWLRGPEVRTGRPDRGASCAAGRSNEAASPSGESSQTPKARPERVPRGMQGPSIPVTVYETANDVRIVSLPGVTARVTAASVFLLVLFCALQRFVP